MTIKKYLLTLCSLLIFFQSIAGESKKTFVSTEEQVALIELYSSEGCSSCPPADQWLSRLKSHPGLWKEFVPIAFHVDYWNRLGWVDRFSTKEFTKRQHNYASEWKQRRVYTPAFVKNGKEWRSRKKLKSKPNKAGILKVVKISAETFEVFFKSKIKSDFEINGALLGQGLVTQVKYGENKGEILRHEFVVLSQNKVSLKKEGEHYRSVIKIKANDQAKASSYSIAFWVNKIGSQVPIQATGGAL